MSRILTAALALTLLPSCANKAEVDELKAQVAKLDEKVQELESKGVATKAAAGADQETEKKALDLYKSIGEHTNKGEYDDAKAKLNTLLKDYKGTKVASRASRMKRELDVIGKSVDSIEVEKWYTAQTGLNMSEGAHLLVFWEIWCPHCKREVPKMQATYDKYKDKMNMVGLTRLTKSATEEKVTAFIQEQNVTYPMAKEGGKVAETFAVSGIPAAAMVKDGKVVWRGHPGRLNDEMIDRLITN